VTHSSWPPPQEPLDEEATGRPPGPSGQVSVIVTDFAADSKTTRAVAAGPLVTSDVS
jgi:hypothetical protein